MKPTTTTPGARETPIDGIVVDAATALPIAGAAVAIVGAAESTVSDARGRFHFPSLTAGRYRLKVDRRGYQPSVSSEVVLTPGRAAFVTLALQRVATGAPLRVIAQTGVSASASLQKSSVIYRTLSAEVLERAGVYRAGDALRALPGVNNGITGDTAALADDLNLSIRGIGTLETTTTLDGHPIAQGFPGGYNANLSPVLGLRDVSVIYGSGANGLGGVTAIGGVVDFATIDPTPDQRVSITQGYGTFDKLATNLQATGTIRRLGYALNLGVAGLDGPLKQALIPQPGAAFDPSAPVGSLAYPLYEVDSAAVARAGVLKLRYALSDVSRLTFTALADSEWENKTGNGDADYLGPQAALALGELLLQHKSAKDPCPPGEFQPLNPFGVPAGIGPNGRPDGGVPCQTPQQYAQFNTGYDGAGPAWQALNLNDERLAFETAAGKHALRLDAFTDRYLDTIDRTAQLPYESVPNDQASWRNSQEVETGVVASDAFATGANNELGGGFSFLNSAFSFERNGALKGAPIIRDTAFFVRDVYRPVRSPLAVYANASLKSSTATHTSRLDPRLSLVYTLSVNDVVRVAAGETSTQPSADAVGLPFVETPLGGAGGGTAINCSGLNAIGTPPSSLLKPERGVDVELAYGHRFANGSLVQLQAYTVNVLDKLYGTLIPLSTTGTSFIDPAYLTAQTTQLASHCGIASSAAAALLALSGTVNAGQLRARGVTVSGRARIDRRTFVDYDWDLDSTVLTSAPVELLEANTPLIIGSQLPRLPLHTLTAELNHTFGRDVDVRYVLHAVSANNTKGLPAYNYSDLVASAPLGSGTLSTAIGNLFNQNAEIRGLRYEGAPLALNRYATAADYAPYTGIAATERFGLPYRSIFFGYTLQTR